MPITRGLSTLCLLAGLAVSGGLRRIVLGQTPNSTPPTSAMRMFNRVPSLLHPHLAALGPRLRSTGKEQTIYSGEIVDEAGRRSPVQVTVQLPGLVRLEGVKPGGPLSFDGQRTTGVASALDDSLIETFVMDLPEGMFDASQRSAALRLLGRGFGSDPRSKGNRAGPRYDIYELMAPVVSRPDQPVRSRLYYFDSQSGLLQSTRYYDRTNKIETRFSNWKTLEGSAYPGRIDHYENGRLVFSFEAKTIVAAAATEPSRFR